jgi:hypothetical protein
MSGKQKGQAKNLTRVASAPKAGPHRIRKAQPPKRTYRGYVVRYFTKDTPDLNEGANGLAHESHFSFRQEAVDYAKSLIRNSRSKIVYLYGSMQGEGDRLITRYTPSDTDPSLKPYPRRDVIPFVTKPVVKVGRI